MDWIFYSLLFLFVIWILYKQFVPIKNLRNLSAAEFKDGFKSGKLIDVRESYEFAQGHIPGAVNIPLSVLGRKVDEIPRDRPIYLYCRSGARSKQAGKILSRNGFTQIAHLVGGIMAWDGPQKK